MNVMLFLIYAELDLFGKIAEFQIQCNDKGRQSYVLSKNACGDLAPISFIFCVILNQQTDHNVLNKSSL